MSITKNYLLGYENMYIYQDNDMFNFSLDSVLLANFVTINKKDKKIMDIGCGNAPIPLIISTRTKSDIVGVEIQKEVYDLAVKSVEENNLQDQIKILNRDINELYEELESDTFDVITCNPPYFKYKETSNVNDSKYKVIARLELMLDIPRLLKISRKLLKNNGILAIVHRPERLMDILMEMKNNNIEPKKIQLIYPSTDKEANILLVEGSKNGKPGLKIMPPIYAHLENGDYTEDIKRFFEKR